MAANERVSGCTWWAGSPHRPKKEAGAAEVADGPRVPCPLPRAIALPPVKSLWGWWESPCSPTQNLSKLFVDTASKVHTERRQKSQGSQRSTEEEQSWRVTTRRQDLLQSHSNHAGVSHRRRERQTSGAEQSPETGPMNTVN